MNRLNPCKWNDFIRRLRLGFDGPYSGSKHQFMIFGHNRLAVPTNPEYSVPQLKLMLREVAEIIGHEVAADEWSSLK